MSQQQNIDIARLFLQGMGGGQDPETIANLFDQDLSYDIQGDDSVLPWIGRKAGRQAIVDFISQIRVMTEPITFEIEDILASDSRAAIVGALQTRIKRTGRITTSQFAIVLTIAGGKIIRFQMLENSYDVSKAATPDG